MRTSLALLLTTTLLPAAAFGHANLVSPTPRNTLANKSGPCGATTRGAPTYVKPGSMLKVDFVETIDHPGHYEVLFSPNGEANCNNATSRCPVVLNDNIADLVKPGGSNQAYSVMVKLPDTPCTNCVLQLIQSMEETPSSPSLYYSCADLVLGDPPADGGAADDAAAPPTDGGTAVSSDAAAPSPDLATRPGEPPAGMFSSGCSAAGAAGAASPAWPLLLLAAAALRRRRG